MKITDIYVVRYGLIATNTHSLDVNIINVFDSHKEALDELWDTVVIEHGVADRHEKAVKENGRTKCGDWIYEVVSF